MYLYKIGSRGAVVKEIQKVVGCYPDGIFGEITEECVKEWQKAHSLTPDGIVGPATFAKMFTKRFKKSKRSITEIVIHCSATPDGKSYTVDDIRKWHKDRGFSDIGYHYVVYRNGCVELGRDVDIAGAHVQGHNAHTIGICYIGGMDKYGKIAKDTRTLAQKASLLSLLTDLRKLYPTAKICGHRDFSEDLNKNGILEPWEWMKECPCFDAIKEYSKL